MNLPIQDYLLNNSIESLTSIYGLTVKEYDNCYVVNYSQTDTPKTDERWWDCRGLILSKDFRNILCRPFTRFFNLGELGEDTFDFSSAFVFEKLDGSLCSTWFNPYDNKWEVATRKQAFAEGNLIIGNKTFRELFLEAGFNGSEENFQESMNKLNEVFPNHTWMFELTAPENRVVTPYTEKNIWYLAARDNTSGLYLTQSIHFNRYISLNIPSVKYPNMFNLGSIEECHTAIKSLPAMEEGYVVYNVGTQKRIKIKNPEYVLISHLIGNNVLSLKRVLGLILVNEHPEFLSYFPEYTDTFQPVIDALENFKEKVNSFFNEIKHIEIQKDFALKACTTPFAGILFEMRKGSSLNDCLMNRINVEKLLELIGVEDDEVHEG